MPVLLAEGIVTRYVNYRENDRIITILSPDRGRIDAKARGCRKPTSPLLPACQPFVYGQFELYAAKDKNTINQCDIKESFFPLREDYQRFSYGAAMLQLAHNGAQENEPNQRLFSLLYHALSYLAYGSAAPEDLFCCFLVRYLHVMGYQPSITACARCGRDVRSDAVIRFSPMAGGAVCAACDAFARPVSKTALEGMRRMLLLEDDGMDKVRLSEAICREISGILATYAAYVLDYGEKALGVLTSQIQQGERSPGEP